MSIRPWREADARDAHRLVCELEGTDLPWDGFMRTFGEALSSGRSHGLVWEHGGRVAGLIELRVERQLHHARPVAEIMELVVDECARGAGVGTALFDAARDLAQGLGCELIEVRTNVARGGAHRFYGARGMSLTHRGYSERLLAAARKERT